MGLEIIQQPTTPNVTGTKLVFALSSSDAGLPQYNFITDIYESGSSDLLVRLKTYPNLSGSSVVDIAPILSDYLDYDNDWKITTPTEANSSFKGFDIKIGEAYGSSVSSSVTEDPDIISASLFVYPGTVDENNGSSYNLLDSGSFTLLTNCYNGLLDQTDHYTVSVFVPRGRSSSISASLYSELGGNLGNKYYAITSDPTDDRVITYPFGSGSGFTQYSTERWHYMEVELDGSSYKIYRDEPCNDEGVSFAFINDYGYYDYYKVPNPVRKVTSIDRKTYEQEDLNYSSKYPTYDNSRRGEVAYMTSYNDVFEVTTDYLDKQQADWLTELFDSSEVYIQSSGSFEPVNITSINYSWNESQNRTKLFQYNIRYKKSNQRYSR